MKRNITKSIIKNASYFFKNKDNLWNHDFCLKIHYSHLVTWKVIKYIQENNIESVCLFLNELDQINTLGIMKWCLNNNIKLFVYNYEPNHNEFVVHPVTNLEFSVVNCKSYKNIVVPNDKDFKNFKIDLLIAPVYFTDDDKISFYYEMKNYSQLIKISHQKLIGIGYENVTINHEFWNFLKKKNKFYRLNCDEIFLASKLK